MIAIFKHKGKKVKFLTEGGNTVTIICNFFFDSPPSFRVEIDKKNTYFLIKTGEIKSGLLLLQTPLLYLLPNSHPFPHLITERYMSYNTIVTETFVIDHKERKVLF